MKKTFTIQITKKDYDEAKAFCFNGTPRISNCVISRAFARHKKKKIGTFCTLIDRVWRYGGRGSIYTTINSSNREKMKNLIFNFDSPHYSDSDLKFPIKISFKKCN